MDGVKRTRKWAFVAQEATRLAGLGLSLAAIAKRLEVDYSTVRRWRAAGRLDPVGGVPVPDVSGATPEQWAAAVRAAYSLDATDDQLVSLAEDSLRLARDLTVSPATRLSASGRFQALVKQLALVARSADVPKAPEAPPDPPARVLPKASGEDPRRLVMVSR